MNVFFTSDTHFGHANIIKYCNRPFASKEEMDAVLLENWNSTVKPGDRIYHLGDFAFLKSDAARDLLKKLNGEKILIKGNHDKSKGTMQGLGFNQVYDSLQIEIGGDTLWMNHYPYPYAEDPYSFSGDPSQLKDDFRTWLLCGHVHTSWKIKRFKGRTNGMINVGVDQWGFKPISIEELAAFHAGLKNERA